MKTPWTSLILVFPLDNKKKGRIFFYCFCLSLKSKESWFKLGFLVSGVVCNTTHAMIAWQKTVFARNWQRIILIIATMDVVNVVRIYTVKFALESEPFAPKLMLKTSPWPKLYTVNESMSMPFFPFTLKFKIVQIYKHNSPGSYDTVQWYGGRVV